MSIHVMNLVWKKSKHKGSTLLILLAMADYAGDDGTGIWPSYQTLAKKARLSRRQAINIVQSLIESGVIARAGQSAARTNRYQIRLDMIGKEGTGVIEPSEAPPLPKDKSVEGALSAGENFSPSDPDGEKISPGRDADGETRFTNDGEAQFTNIGEARFTQTINNRQNITTRGDANASPRARSPSALRKKRSTADEKAGALQHGLHPAMPDATNGAWPQNPAKPDPDPPGNTDTSAPAGNGSLSGMRTDRNRAEEAILRARCSEPARALMQAFYRLTGIAYTRAWPSAAETMAEAGVTASDLRAALEEARRGRWTVNDPHSLTKTAIRIASTRAAYMAPGEEIAYDAASNSYIVKRTESAK